MPSSTAFLSVFHRFCWDTEADILPSWEKLGNKSYFCLHVEAHGKILAHFSPGQVFVQELEKIDASDLRTYLDPLKFTHGKASF